MIHDEFLKGNVAPATGNLEFIKACGARMPCGHAIAHVRLDSAGYQAGIFNYLDSTGKTFAIGGRLDAPTQQAIAGIPESGWKHYHDCAVAENGIKELKIGFGMERMPCGQFAANAAFFRIGVIAHNLFVLFKRSALGEDWQRHKVATVRWRLFHLPGMVVRHARAWVLKIATESVGLFRSVREKNFELAMANAP